MDEPDITVADAPREQVGAASPAGEALTTSPAPEASVDAPNPIADIDAWFARHIPDSRYSRDTRAYNVIFNAVAAIKAALASVRE